MKHNSLTQTSFSLTHTSHSFTLIELMVSVFIFSMLMSVGMASMTIMWHSKSKLTGSKTVQETGRLAMETITNDIKSADGTVSGYKNFKIPILGGSELDVYQSDGSVINTYTLSGSIIMKNGQPLTSPDVNVTELKFEGQDGGAQGANPKEPYVTINMSVQTTDQTDVNKKASAVFKTSVVAGDVYSSGIHSEEIPYLYAFETRGGGIGQVHPFIMAVNKYNFNTTDEKEFSDKADIKSMTNDWQNIYMTKGTPAQPDDVYKYRLTTPLLSSLVPAGNFSIGENVFKLALDDNYFYFLNNGANSICKVRRNDLFKECRSNFFPGFPTHSPNVDLFVKNGHLFVSNISSVAKILDADMTGSPANWQVVNSTNDATEISAMAHDDNYIWTTWATRIYGTDAGQVCRWDINNLQTVPVCRNQINKLSPSTAHVHGGTGIAAENGLVYITNYTISGGVASINVSNSDPTQWVLIRKKDWININGNNPIFDKIITGLQTQYRWVYE